MQTIYQHLTDAMNDAAALALQGPSSGPNPQVGCIILDANNAVLSTGFHRGAGTAHAEADALSALGAPLPEGATAVVTLEPCNHEGRTGPCVDALISAGVSNVVYAAKDPGPQSGEGAKRLQAAGIETTLLSTEATTELNHRWLTAMKNGRPYTIAKWASTLDGRIAAQDGSSQWISSEMSRRHAHLMRQSVDAILIGTGTALIDNPSLTARKPDGTLFDHQPLPIVVGYRNLPDDAHLLQHPTGLKTFRNHNLGHVMSDLFDDTILSTIIEGGSSILGAAFAEDLVDEVHIYFGPKLLGGPKTVLNDIGVKTMAEAKEFTLHEVTQLDNDIFLRYRKHAPQDTVGTADESRK